MALKILIVVFSALASLLSLIFMLNPKLFRKIEEFLGMEFGNSGESFATVLEGKINFVNDWVFNNRIIFGPLFALVAAINTRNLFFI